MNRGLRGRPDPNTPLPDVVHTKTCPRGGGRDWRKLLTKLDGQIWWGQRSKGKTAAAVPHSSTPRTNSSAEAAWLLKWSFTWAVVISRRCLEFLLPGFGPRLSKADAKPAFPLQTLVFGAFLFRLFDAAAALFPLALRLHLIIWGTRWRRAARQQPGNKWAIFSMRRYPPFTPSITVFKELHSQFHIVVGVTVEIGLQSRCRRSPAR